MANEKARPSIFWVLAALVLPVLNAAVRFEIRHAERLPRTGSYVLAPNHHSEIDPVVMGAVAWKLGRLPRFLAKASLFDVPVVGWFLRRSGQIPVQRDGGVRGRAAADRRISPMRWRAFSPRRDWRSGWARRRSSPSGRPWWARPSRR